MFFGFYVLTGEIQLTPDMDFHTWQPPKGMMATAGGLFIAFSLGTFFAPFLPGANKVYQERNRPRTFGDARFSTLAELVKAQLVGAAGVSCLAARTGSCWRNPRRSKAMCWSLAAAERAKAGAWSGSAEGDCRQLPV